MDILDMKKVIKTALARKAKWEALYGSQQIARREDTKKVIKTLRARLRTEKAKWEALYSAQAASRREQRELLADLEEIAGHLEGYVCLQNVDALRHIRYLRGCVAQLENIGTGVA